MYNFNTPEEILRGGEMPWRNMTRTLNSYADRLNREWTPEEIVLGTINTDYKTAYELIDYTPGKKQPGFFRSLFSFTAGVGMYSSDPNIARQSIVYTVQDQLARHHERQTIQQRAVTVEQEYRHALALADEYFHGEERRLQAEADERRHARMVAEELADALVRRANQ